MKRKTPQQQQSVAATTPGSIKFNFKKMTSSPRKSKGPTPQLQTGDRKKYCCDKCNFTSDRVNVISIHMRAHTSEPTPTKTPVRRLPIYSATTPVTKAVEKQSLTTPRRSQKPPVAKVTPTPKKTATSRKRKFPQPPTIAKEEILGDWSDGEEDLPEPKVQPLLRGDEEVKKPRTDFKDLFDSLVQSKQSTSTDKIEVTDKQEVTDDDKKEVTDDKTEVTENDDDDMKAKFDELMEETAPKLPSFDNHADKKQKIDFNKTTKLEHSTDTSEQGNEEDDVTVEPELMEETAQKSPSIDNQHHEVDSQQTLNLNKAPNHKDEKPPVVTSEQQQKPDEVPAEPQLMEETAHKLPSIIDSQLHNADNQRKIDLNKTPNHKDAKPPVITSEQQQKPDEVPAEPQLMEETAQKLPSIIDSQLHNADNQQKLVLNKTPNHKDANHPVVTSEQPKQEEVPVEQVVHLVPVQNPDGSVAYMFISLNENDELKIARTESDVPPPEQMETLYIDKDMDYETLMETLTQQPRQQQLQQQQILQQQLQVSSQAPSRQPPVSQQFKQMNAAAAAAAAAANTASTSQQQQQLTQYVTEAGVPVGVPLEQFIIGGGAQEILNLQGSNAVATSDGTYMNVDLNQLSRENILFMTEDGSIFDPSSCGVDIQQLFSQQ